MNALTMVFLAGVATSFGYSGNRCDYLQTLEKAQRLTGRVAVARQVLYNGGRVASYVLLGGLAALLGCLLIAEPTTGRVSEIVFAPRALAILSGAFLILGAIRLHGWMPLPAPQVVAAADSFGGMVAVLGGPRSAATPIGFGAVRGLLPCPIVYAMLAVAAQSADPARGMELLLAFGLGTVPLMLLTTLIGDRCGALIGRLGAHPAAAYLMALGLLALGSGLLPILGRGPFAS